MNFLQTGLFLSILKLLSASSYFRKYLLVKQLSQKVWRRSSFGSYVLIKIVNGVALTEDPIPLQPESVVSTGCPKKSHLLENSKTFDQMAIVVGKETHR